ncbi:gliding motility-associated protein GldM [Dysgonomonas sp. PFB1-18]|uniref:type IX secretion system motor protein PorM/GldM n=1 Tax=unclassified Dysgonomonas TaxID=2630389 RepID=UPI0024764890|nr:MULTISPECIES: gliding motility protein GldM [unclassified Dysgonomonas]MDH6307853.1 gliding motility-associated protein GldM [Dysgonomonas sp. PF1-14]MDH6337771.1 gliding motility-associated protein GldM [Dysgonomonas sp. PF1-16]MDH6378995.1 gliding motility-associated protein GldM [Dysgonomonas sp. PFB1-18]MDH6396630.1 gliding motility-associated protein GldM [Dysgonomonas sp. PF1-23]
MALSKGQMTRQKMINLMYLVFIAMLALNVSTEVLDGFVLINDNLQETIKVAEDRNNRIYADIEAASESNPQKAEEFFNDAKALKLETDSLFNYIQSLKLKIAQKSDGEDADINNLESKDNIDASTDVIISPVGGQGNKLKKDIDEYRESVLKHITDSAKQDIVRRTLSTEPSARAKKDGKTWLQASFERMPSIAAITFLSELQANVRQAEGEVLNVIAQNIDMKDLRVNSLNAYVVPQSNMVMRGTTYKANIIMAAVDTTQDLRIVINGKELPTEKKGLYEFGVGTPGNFEFSGYIELMDRLGNPLRREFTQKYTVMEPMATIAPLLMDVLYVGIGNDVSISVPGVATSNVTARVVEGGTLTPKSGGIWTAQPAAANIGKKFIISVSANVNGVNQQIATKEFRIRALPDPLPYIEYADQNGNLRKFRKGPLARATILNTRELKASIDDGVLDIQYKVLSFTTLNVDAMGNATKEMSNGANFSDRQLDQIRRMQRGGQIFITGIKARGPDGDRDLYSMDVRIN